MAQFKADTDILTANDSGPRAANVPLFVIHYYGGGTFHKSVEDLAPWLLNPNSGASYTGIIDGTGRTARINDDNYIPWAAHPTGNRLGRHWSLAGGARTRAEWLESMDQLTALAEVIAHDHAEYGTEIRHLSHGEVFRARNDWSVRGVCTHGDISKAFGESTHDDPGAEFPMDVVLQLARDIAAGNRPPASTPNDPPPPTVEDVTMTTDMTNTLSRIERKCDLILDQLAGPRDKHGNQTFAGWSQGGNRSLYDLTAAIAEVEGVSGAHDTKYRR